MKQISIEKAKFIKEYINKIEECFAIYEDNLEFSKNDDILIASLLETIKVLESDIPSLTGSVFLKHDTLTNDAQIVISILKKYLIDNGHVVEEKDDKSFDKFCKSFKLYFESVLPQKNILKDEYLHYDNWNGGTYYNVIDYNEQFILNYGVEFNTDKFNNFDYIKMFLELAYNDWIKIDKRYDFTKEINDIFKKFKLPYQLKSGKIVSKGYRTTVIDEKIINFSMLERKVKYAEEMILSKEILDKKSALDYIVDSLQYLISIQKGSSVKDKYSNAAIMISGDKLSKQYTVVNKEIIEIMKIVNEFFDIRHNEYLNKSNEVRESLNNSLFIEYMYNRIYGLLFIMKIKYNSMTNFN